MAWGSSDWAGGWGGTSGPTTRGAWAGTVASPAQPWSPTTSTGLGTFTTRRPWSPTGSAGLRTVADPVSGRYGTASDHGPYSRTGPDTTQDGFMQQPGTGEQWWATHQNEINQNGQLGDFLQGSAGRLFGMDYAPNNTGTQYQNMVNQLGGPQQGTQNAWGVSGQLRNQTQGEGMQGQAAGMLGGPNLAHGYANDTAGFFKAPGRSEGYADATIPGLGAINYGERGLAATDALSRNTGDYYDNTLRDAANQNFVGSEAANFMPGLRDKSYSEKLYESGNTGLDSAYQREADKRSRDLANRMSAMGVFGSGATARSLSEMQADLGASQARDMASLADQADQQRLGRTDAARLFADTAGREGIARMDLGLRGASAADENNRGNVNTYLNATGQASNEALARTRLGGDLANQADTNALARTLGGATVARSGDESLINQANSLGTIGHNLTGDETSRLAASSATGLAGDTENRSRANDLFGAGMNLDKARQDAARLGLSVEQYLGQMTGISDTQNWNRTLGRFGAAKDVQSEFEKRWNDQFGNTLDLAKAQAGIDSGVSGKSADADAAAVHEYVQSLVASGQLSAQQGQQAEQEFLQLIGLGISAYKAF